MKTKNAPFKVPLFFLLLVLMNVLTSIQPMYGATIQQHGLQFNIMFIITSSRFQEWVQTLKHMVLPTGSVILKAEVRPSHKASNRRHHPWVAIKKIGTTVIGHCNCISG